MHGAPRDRDESGPSLVAGESRGTYLPGRMTPMRNAWFALVHASKVSKKPLQRMLFGEPIVIWRSASGAVVAMEDRCAHRRTPLSAGRVVGDGIQCGYHGWTYSGDGDCTLIPSLRRGARMPAGVCVKSYSTAIRYGFVWVWWGDKEAADTRLIPDVPFIHPDRPVALESTYLYDTSSDLLVENLIDLTHLDFVHGWLLGDPHGGEEDVSYVETAETLTMQRRSSNRKPPAAQAALMGFPGAQDIVQTTRVYLRSNCVVAAIWYRPPGWGLAVVLPNVAETATRTRNDYSLVVTGSAVYRWMVKSANQLIGWQDNGILKAQQPAYHDWSHMSQDRHDRSVDVDKACLRYRALRQAMLDRQQRGDLAYGPDWEGAPADQALEISRVD